MNTTTPKSAIDVLVRCVCNLQRQGITLDLQQDTYATEEDCLLAVSRLFRKVPDCRAEPAALRCGCCLKWHPGFRAPA